MNCDDFKNLIIVDIYGKLTASQQTEMSGHAHNCPVCAQLYDQTKKYQSLIEDGKEIPTPDWEQSWEVICERVLKKRKRFAFVYQYKKFALASAAVVVIFVLGFFVGRQLFAPGSNGSPFEAGAGYSYTSHRHYAENLELLLINFLNRTDQEAAKDFIKIEKRIISDMLTQTRLLKRMASRARDSYLQDLLEDVELILIGMSNLKTEDRESADQLNQFIHEKSLKFRLRQLVEKQSA